MLVVIYFSHVMVLTILFIHLKPARGEKEYKELFYKNLPTFYSISYWSFIIAYFYFIIDFFTRGWIGVNYIDSFDTTKCYIIMAFYAVVIFNLLLSKVKKEIQNVRQEIKKVRSLAVPFIYFYLYLSSVLLSVIVFHFTNHFLDFSSGEEHVVTVTGSYSKIIGKGRNASTHYELSIRPSVYKLNKLEVSCITKGLVNNGNKIKIYVYKGLYGVRYVSNSIDLK